MKEVFHVVLGLHSGNLFLFSEKDTVNFPKIINVNKESNYWEAFEFCGRWYDLNFLDEDGVSMVKVYSMFGLEDNMETDTSENGEQTVYLYII